MELKILSNAEWAVNLLVTTGLHLCKQSALDKIVSDYLAGHSSNRMERSDWGEATLVSCGCACREVVSHFYLPVCLSVSLIFISFHDPFFSFFLCMWSVSSDCISFCPCHLIPHCQLSSICSHNHTEPKESNENLILLRFMDGLE